MIAGKLVGLIFYVVFFFYVAKSLQRFERCVGLAKKVGTDAFLIPPFFRVVVFSPFFELQKCVNGNWHNASVCHTTPWSSVFSCVAIGARSFLRKALMSIVALITDSLA